MDQSEQRGFTGTVATDQAEPFTSLDLPIRRLEQYRAAEADGHILEAHQRHTIFLPDPGFETSAECSILFKFKESDPDSIGINHRNILDILRIKF